MKVVEFRVRFRFKSDYCAPEIRVSVCRKDEMTKVEDRMRFLRIDGSGASLHLSIRPWLNDKHTSWSY